MNNRNEKKDLNLEYPKKKYSLLQYTWMNENKKINNNIIRFFILINVLIIIIFINYFQNSKNNIKKTKEDMILILIL